MYLCCTVPAVVCMACQFMMHVRSNIAVSWRIPCLKRIVNIKATLVSRETNTKGHTPRIFRPDNHNTFSSIGHLKQQEIRAPFDYQVGEKASGTLVLI